MATRISDYGPALVLLALFAAFVPVSVAQRAGASHAAVPSHASVPHFPLPKGSFAFARNSHAARNPRRSPLTSLPFPFLTDSFDPNDLYATGYPVSSQPPEFLLQAARAMGGSEYLNQPAAEAGNHAASSTQPLMIELQGDHYVRVNPSPIDGEALPLAGSSTVLGRDSGPGAGLRRAPSAPRPGQNATTAPANSMAAPRANDMPSAVLVFRDGHREDVRDYTIADGTLYARGDLYTDGYWNKKIDLATLNIPETLQANETRNVNFVLPSSPNEVITRP